VDYGGGDRLDREVLSSPLKRVVDADEGSDTDFQDRGLETDIETGEDTDASHTPQAPTTKGMFQGCEMSSILLIRRYSARIQESQSAHWRRTTLQR
jgi:hypothetical protein